MHETRWQREEFNTETKETQKDQGTRRIFLATIGKRHGSPASSGGRLGSKVFTLEKQNSWLTARLRPFLMFHSLSVSLQSRHLAEGIQKLFQTAGSLAATDFRLVCWTYTVHQRLQGHKASARPDPSHSDYLSIHCASPRAHRPPAEHTTSENP